MTSILWIILVIFVVVWLAGFLLRVGGNAIHLLLAAAAALLIYNLLVGRRSS